MKKYKVKTKFVFEGEFIVKADSVKEAQEVVIQKAHLVMGGDVHTDDDDTIINWHFDTHPEKHVYRPKIKKKKKRII